MDNQSLSHVRWKCRYHIVFRPKHRKKVLYSVIDVIEICPIAFEIFERLKKEYGFNVRR